MFDTKRDKYFFTLLLEDFIRETEHSLAYFFALIVFLFTFLLTLFGREAFYTGLIGVFCLFFIKLRDIIDGFREVHSGFFFSDSLYPPECSLNCHGKLPDENAVLDFTKELKQKINTSENRSGQRKTELLFLLQALRETLEDIRSFFPKRPFRPETSRAIMEMTSIVRKYQEEILQKNFHLNKEQSLLLHDILSESPEDYFLTQVRLESAGLNERSAEHTVRLLKILKNIEKYVGESGASDNAAGKNETG